MPQHPALSARSKLTLLAAFKNERMKAGDRRGVSLTSRMRIVMVRQQLINISLNENIEK
jgi:hypothetical protein